MGYGSSLDFAENPMSMSQEEAQGPKHPKRTRKLIKASLQLRLTLIFVSLAVLSSIFVLLLVESVMSSALADAGIDTSNVDVIGSLAKAMVLTLMVLVPLMTVIGITVTHRIAGPVYRFETHLKEIANGGDPGPCRIRKNDELQELCSHLNEAVDELRSHDVRTRKAA